MLSSPSSRSHFQSKSKSTRKKLLSLNQSISTCGDDDDEEFEDILNFAPYAKKVEIRKVKEVISIDDSDDESDESMPMSMSMSISKNPPTPPTPQPQPQPAKRKNKTKYNTSKKEKKNEVINICDTSSSSSSNSSSSNSSSSNSSSDDSPPPKKKNKVPTTKIPTTKTSVPLTKEEQSNRRLLDKHNKKLAREKSKQEAKKQKDLDKKVQKQMEGKFDVLEIAVVVEKKLSTTPLGNMLVGSLTVNTSNPTPTTTSAQKRESASFKHFVEDDEDEKEVENAIRWKRLGLDEGGADEAMNFGKYADLVCVLFHEPARFLDLLEKEKEKDEEDFPKLKKWIDKIVERNKEVEKEEEEDDDEEKEEEEEQQQEEKTRGTKREKTRIIVILPGIKNELNKQWKKNKRSSWSPTTMENLQDALVWMLIQHNVEYELCENEKEAIGFVRGVTVALAEEVYEENLGGACELDCIEKIKVTNKLSNATELQVASDCWYRMLQQILGVSSKKASTVLEYYPTLMSVLEGYEKCEDEDDKKLLLCKCFNKNKVEAVLSEKVYFVLTRSDSGLIL